MTDPAVVQELRKIAERHGGALRPADVVKAARPESSPLHSKFEWDDYEAAATLYRIWQARQLISVTVETVGAEGSEVVARVFISLTPDRVGDGGYSSVEAVMLDPARRKQMLADALDELERVQRKYDSLKELVDVFRAIKSVRNRNRDTRFKELDAEIGGNVDWH